MKREWKKLSDLTGNPWDDLTARQQQDILNRLSRETYRAWTNAATKPDQTEAYRAAMRVCMRKGGKR